MIKEFLIIIASILFGYFMRGANQGTFAKIGEKIDRKLFRKPVSILEDKDRLLDDLQKHNEEADQANPIQPL